MDQAKKILKDLTGKRNIYLKGRGNYAIREALRLLQTDRKKLLIQDQGGWLRYLNYPGKYGFEVEKIKTNNGVIDLDSLKESSFDAAGILYEDPAGYIAQQPIKEIFDICSKNGCKVILDITGSIGYRAINGLADIIIASFGKGKPVNLAYGGMLASDNSFELTEDFELDRIQDLLDALKKLPKRQEFLRNKHNEIKAELSGYNIIQKDKEGINVVVGFDNQEEKEKIIKYCDAKGLPYTICPRYIRVMRDAISIEVKSL
ncbi:MAG: hypothetical protein ACQESF_01225 [Nanobdellota archaeon]